MIKKRGCASDIDRLFFSMSRDVDGCIENDESSIAQFAAYKVSGFSFFCFFSALFFLFFNGIRGLPRSFVLDRTFLLVNGPD